MKAVNFFIYSMLVAGGLALTSATIKAVKRHKAKKQAKTEITNQQTNQQ